MASRFLRAQQGAESHEDQVSCQIAPYLVSKDAFLLKRKIKKESGANLDLD
jgi:hypothetical protein